MDYKNLSQIKHIYKIYQSPNNYWHCEKYPVIYVNKKYLYYKIGADEELVSKRIDYIRDNFIISNPFQGTFINVDEFDSEIVNEKAKENAKSMCLLSAQTRFNSAEREYLRAKQELEKLTNE